MAVPELVPPVPVRDRLPVGAHDARQADQGGEHGEMARDRVVEPREQAVDGSHRISGMDEDTRVALPRPLAVQRPCGLERTDDRGPDRHDTVTLFAGAVHQLRRVS